jgi:transposase
MRLHRGGNREANRSMHLIAVARLRIDPRTQFYMERGTRDGLSKRDAILCLKRFITREVFIALHLDLLER